MPKVRPKKSLGQHFLTDIPTVERIAATVDALPDLPILEVGPGMGVLTSPLLARKRELKVVVSSGEYSRTRKQSNRRRFPENPAQHPFQRTQFRAYGKLSL